MNKSESKYYNTALLMDQALISLIEKKDYDFITVKDICEKAGVNRSTFYLHYETKEDLLKETLENIDKEFYESFDNKDIVNKIKTCDIKELNFVTPRYLKPYLIYILNHKQIYAAKINHPEIMDSYHRYDVFNKNIIIPILERFKASEIDKKYILSYTISGIQGLINKWVETGCVESVEEISDCIIRYMIK